MSDYPALDIKPIASQDMMRPLAEMAGISNAMLANQRSRLEINQLAATQQEQKTIQQLMGDPNSGLFSPDGTVNVQEAPKIFANAGVKYLLPQAVQTVNGIAKDQVAFKTSLNALNTDQRKQIAGVVGAAKSPQDLYSGLDTLIQQNPQIPAASIMPVIKYGMGIKDPNQFQQFTAKYRAQMLSPSEQTNYTAPQLTTTQSGAPALLTRDLQGGASLSYPGGTTAAGQKIPVYTTPGSAEAEASSATTGMQRYQNMITQDQGYQNRRNTLQNIVDLAHDIRTGVGAEQRAKLESAITEVFPGFSLLKDDATKLHELQKLTTQYYLQSAQAAGAQTDAARAATESANPNIHYTPDAVSSLAKRAMAAEDAAHAQTNSARKWLKGHGNSPDNMDQFMNDWSNSADFRLFQMKNMNLQEQVQFLRSQPDAKALAEKWKRMKAMMQ